MPGWTSYRNFWFEGDKAEIQNADTQLVAEIAVYMKKNPSLQLGIDGSLDPQNNNGDRALCDRRATAIRDALIKEGVPAHRITLGVYGDVKLKRDRRVEVLFATAK